ncbi:hypothetical protein COMA1_60047 [Candidatus Nitrospira nitrosa]|uniref:Uncharacterized protein n=1 Tax=Candidatus Nitrospira nitrosa TaxID=1742972 RepID=A0A0S4LML7_9BACT|nr:hypothetical protein COMA1_60047 [Candidatus Nitrospira nitrosa]
MARMLEQQLDQAAFPGAKVALHTSTGQAMQYCHGLLS